MKLWATDEVRAKSKFWYVLSCPLPGIYIQMTCLGQIICSQRLVVNSKRTGADSFVNYNVKLHLFQLDPNEGMSIIHKIVVITPEITLFYFYHLCL